MVTKFTSDLFDTFGIMIQKRGLPDSILSIQRNKTRRADFFNRIPNDAADLPSRLDGSVVAKQSSLSLTQTEPPKLAVHSAATGRRACCG